MSGLISGLVTIWYLCVGWMPPALASAVTIAIIVLFIFIIIKLIGMILNAIPFL